MNQIIHIFKKDIRRHWPEVAASLALLVAFAWNDQTRWLYLDRSFDLDLYRHNTWSNFSYWLLLFSWLIMIVRVIHEESLVGDRQFWITRPYEWKKLLTAKVLFVLAFLNLPWLIVSVFLLTKAGFAPSEYLPGLLWMQLLMALFLLLPVAALGAVTSSLAQLVLVVLGLLGLLVLTVLPWVWVHGIAGPMLAGLELITYAFLIAAFVGVAIWQYRLRKTAQARLLLVGAVAVYLLVVFAMPRDLLIAHQYPLLATGQPLPVQLSLGLIRYTPQADFINGKQIYLNTVLGVSGIEPDSAVWVDGTKMEVDAPGGLHWSSGWRSTQFILVPNQDRAYLFSPMDKAFYERIKSSPLNVRISFAMTVFHTRDKKEVIATVGDFAALGNICSIPTSTVAITNGNYVRNSLSCRAPRQSPERRVIKVSAPSAIPCPVSDPAKSPVELTGHSWGAHNVASPIDSLISPVQDFTLHLTKDQGWNALYDASMHQRLCPGTTLIFSAMEEVQKLRTETVMSGVPIVQSQSTASAQPSGDPAKAEKR